MKLSFDIKRKKDENILIRHSQILLSQSCVGHIDVRFGCFVVRKIQYTFPTTRSSSYVYENNYTYVIYVCIMRLLLLPLWLFLSISIDLPFVFTYTYHILLFVGSSMHTVITYIRYERCDLLMVQCTDHSINVL